MNLRRQTLMKQMETAKEKDAREEILNRVCEKTLNSLKKAFKDEDSGVSHDLEHIFKDKGPFQNIDDVQKIMPMYRQYLQDNLQQLLLDAANSKGLADDKENILSLLKKITPDQITKYDAQEAFNRFMESVERSEQKPSPK